MQAVARLLTVAAAAVLVFVAPAATALAPLAPLAPSPSVASVDADVAVVESGPFDLTPVLEGLPADADAAAVREAVEDAEAAASAASAPALAARLRVLERGVGDLSGGSVAKALAEPVARVVPSPRPVELPVDVADPVPGVLALVPTAEPAVAPGAVAVGAAGSAAVSTVFQFLGRFYSRMQRGEALDHPMRRRVFDAIVASPGTSPTDLREALGLANGALLHHLDVLRREGLVTRVAEGRFVRLFVTGRYSPGEMRSRAVALAGSPARLLDAVRSRPGLPVREAADAIGLSVPATHRTVRRLEDAGLVERRQSGRAHVLYPATEAVLPA